MQLSVTSTSHANDDIIAVRPSKAEKLLDVGHTRLYALLKAGELESYKDGAATKITMASIRAYVQRQLEKARANAA